MIQKVWNIPGTLEELTRSMTHREYRTRIAWLEENYEDPSRSDFYLMQIATEIRRVLSKKPGRVKMKHFRLKFSERKELSEDKGQQSKRTWFQLLGIKNDGS